MFGSNVTSSWANPQQNQQPQQQQQGGAFGQPAGFGASGAFGQNQPQQQPQANPMFGNLGGTPSTSTSNTGFGTFSGGPNTSQGNAVNPMFGGAKPATGFGAFGGGGSAFGGGGTFGQGTNTAGGSGSNTGLFGQPAATGAAGGFGNTGLFANKTTTPFGSATANAQTSAPPVTTGSSNPLYTVFTEKDTGSNVTLQYQAISCMPAYAGTSHEELRMQDYAQGRKTAGAFGQSAAFGGAPSTNTGIFGAQAAQQNTQPSVFGAGTTNTTNPGGFGAFGSTNTTQGQTAPGSTGLFGGGAFGQQQQPQQQAQPFGSFGAPAQQQQQQPQQQTGGVFGSTFGNNAAKPSAFTPFGGGGGSTFGGGGAFGQQNQQQQQQQQQQPAGGLFGATQTTTPTTGFGAFGNNTANKSIFGGNQQATTQPASTGFGIFGGNQQQPNQQSQQAPTQQPSLFGGGTSLFGGNSQQQQQQPNSQQPTANPLFGSTAAQPGGGLFGGSLFNNNSNQQQQQQQLQQPGQTSGFNLFGTNKPTAPANTSMFSGLNQQPVNNPPQQNIFANSLGQSGNQPPMLGGGSLFGGNKPTVPVLGSSTSNGQGGLFGSTGSNGLFNASASAPGAQGSLTASISQPIGADLPIFSMLPPGPRLITLENSQPKKKAGFFVDIPTRSPVPRVQLGYTPANSKLRGFASSTLTSPAAGGNPFASVSFTSGKPNALSLTRASDNKSLMGTDAFLGRSSSPSLGSGGRQSVKKVILDKKVEPSELFSKSNSSPGSLRGGKVVFSSALSVAAREKDAATSLAVSTNGPTASPTPAPRPQRTPNRFTAQNSHNDHQSDDTAGQPGSATLEEGDYWVKPDLPTLKQAGYDQLSSFKDLIVGRVGYGEIHFLEPVDLTGLPRLGALLGEVVRFDDKECSVYPDSEEVDKPPPGSGLNVKARLSLVRCWAVDKATREPIKDATHAVAIKHLKRLKNMKDTHFESFDTAEGKWTFTVDHF